MECRQKQSAAKQCADRQKPLLEPIPDELRSCDTQSIKSWISAEVQNDLESARIQRNEKILAQISKCPWTLENYLSAF
jgi:hypothetical protein